MADPAQVDSTKLLLKELEMLAVGYDRFPELLGKESLLDKGVQEAICRSQGYALGLRLAKLVVEDFANPKLPGRSPIAVEAPEHRMQMEKCKQLIELLRNRVGESSTIIKILYRDHSDSQVVICNEVLDRNDEAMKASAPVN